MDKRLQLMEDWVHNTLGWAGASLVVASADASFRRYFRIFHNDSTFIAMDAPPGKEDTRPFVDITRRLLKTGVHVPKIIAEESDLGFLMLEDLGNTPYLDRLKDASCGVTDDVECKTLYRDAMQAIVLMQKANTVGLPAYDSNLLYDELALMPEWFLGKHLGITPDEEQQIIIQQTFVALLNALGEQPKGFVHRDYHSRNLMITASNNPGIIDYQDAVYGPLTYDIVSLLRDCYIAWPVQLVEKWALQFRDIAVDSHLIPEMDDAVFLRHFDLMGLQRHIKVLGVFSRLYHRDGKDGYLDDLPLTLNYVLTVGKQYPETAALTGLFEELGIPEKIGIKEIPA
jgi:aminoglycoside/choline kinase family phosphotransferase